MLDLSAPFYTVAVDGQPPETVAVFRDHARADRFYVLPPAPRLARVDGEPVFLVRAWRPDVSGVVEDTAEGGGLVGFEVEAGLSEVVRASVASEVARLAGIEAPEVLPVVFRAGTVRLVLGQEVEGRVREEVTRGVPCGVVSPHRAAFLLPLDARGAALALALARGGEIAAGVVYELVFEGLLPALDARVVLDYERIWQHLSVALSGQYQCVRAELGAELGKLRGDEAIRVEITTFQSEADRARKDELVMRLVQARIEADFFRSALPPGEPEAPNPLAALLGGALGGATSASSAVFVLKARVELTTELRTFTLDFTQRAAVPVTHVSTGLLRRLIPPGEADIQRLDLADPAPRPLEVRVMAPPELGAMPGLVAVTVHLRKGDVAASVLFTPEGPGSARFVVPGVARGDQTYTWSATIDFDPTVGIGPSRVVIEGRTSTERVLVPAVGGLVAVRRARLVRVGDSRRVTAFRVRVRAVRAGTEIASTVVVLDAEGGDAEVIARDPGGAFALHAACETVTDDGRVLAGPEAPVEGGVLLVRAPLRDLLAWRMVPVADWATVRQVVVDVEHGADGALRRHTLTFDAAHAEPETVEVPVWEETDRAIRWKQTLVFVDGRVSEGDWTVPEGSVLTVGQPPADERRVDVVVLNVRPDVLAVRVDLVAEAVGAEPTSLFFGPPYAPTPSAARVPLTDGRLVYRYTVWRYTEANGEERVRDGEDTRAVLVLALP